MKDGLHYRSYILHVGPVRVNGYLLYDISTKEALMIDPGGESEHILSELDSLGLTLKYILLTHAHFDHISGVYALWKATGAKVCMSSFDYPYITDSEWNAANVVKNPPVQEFPVSLFLNDGDTLSIGKHIVKILATPGHTPGGISAYIPGHLFCGDTILKGEIGRYDLQGADVEQSKESIRSKIFILPDNTAIHCGHGEESIVEYEKKNNRIMLQS